MLINFVVGLLITAKYLIEKSCEPSVEKLLKIESKLDFGMMATHEPASSTTCCSYTLSQMVNNGNKMEKVECCVQFATCRFS